MKKFISLLTAAVMVAALVPATAFADATSVKVVDEKKTDAVGDLGSDFPQLQIKVSGDYSVANTVGGEETITLTLDNATFNADFAEGALNADTLIGVSGHTVSNAGVILSDDQVTISIDEINADADELTFTVKGLADGDVIFVNLDTTTTGKKATVAVDVDGGTVFDALTFAQVIDNDIDVTVNKVAEMSVEDAEEYNAVGLDKITIDDVVAGVFTTGDELVLTLKNDFVFDDSVNQAAITAAVDGIGTAVYSEGDTVLTLTLDDSVEKITFPKDLLQIKADEDMGAGATAKITFEYNNADATGGAETYKVSNVAVLKVVDNEGISVAVADEDEDMVQVWAGMTDDDEAWEGLKVRVDGVDGVDFSPNKKIELTLPEGVYVTDVTVEDQDETDLTIDATKYDVEDNVITFASGAFENEIENNDVEELLFAIEFVTKADFKGDVEVTFGGTAFDDEYSVVIAEVNPLYAVTSTTTKVESGYKTLEIPGTVTIKETEADLWQKTITGGDKGELTFGFDVKAASDQPYIEFDAVANSDDSDLDITVRSQAGGGDKIVIDSISDETPGEITMSDIVALIPTTMSLGEYKLRVFYNGFDFDSLDFYVAEDDAASSNIEDVLDYEDMSIVKYISSADTFLNIVAAGTTTAQSSFTNRVQITIGANQIVVNGVATPLEVPAYINADSRTMVPLRAVAVALGVNDDQIVWIGASRTVIINYADTWISMVIGSQIMKVNGIEMAMTTAPEIVNDRTFLPMADLGRALGVTATWDAATRTASFNA